MSVEFAASAPLCNQESGSAWQKRYAYEELMKSVTCRHHAIYVEYEWALPKVYSNVLARFFHSHSRKELSFDLTESSTWLVALGR
jgi:hypothetical protein